MLREFGHLYSDDVRAEAERRFGLARAGSLALEASHSYVFDYPFEDRSVILKITHGSHRQIHQILGELDFTEYLATNGVNLSPPIPSLDGKLVETLEANAGYFLATAYEKAPGALVDWREWTADLFEDWGALIGRMHALAKGYEPSDESLRRRHWHEDRDWHLQSSVPEAGVEFRHKGQRIKDWLLALPTDRDSYGLIHSDLHQWNMLYNGRQLWPIDFDNLRYDWFLSDFTTVIINAVICQERCFQEGDYESWTRGCRQNHNMMVDWCGESEREGWVYDSIASTPRHFRPGLGTP